MKNNILIRLVAIIAIIILAGCTDRQELRLMAEIANHECPFRIDEGMTCTKITLSGNEFQYHIRCDESILSTEFIDIAKEVKTAEEADLTAAYLSEMNSSADGRQILAKLRKNHIKVAYIYTGNITGKSIKLMVNINDTRSVYPYTEIDVVKAIEETAYGGEAADDQTAPDEDLSPSRLLEIAARHANKSCPQPSDDGITITAIKYSGNAFIYEAECDEDQLGADFISNLRESRSALKADLINANAEDYDNNAEFIELLIEGKTVLEYRYYGSHSGESTTVTLQPSEIKKAAKHPQ